MLIKQNSLSGRGLYTCTRTVTNQTCPLHRCPPLPTTTTTAVSISSVTLFPPHRCATDPPLACATLPWQTWQLLITFSSAYSQPDPGCKGLLVESWGPVVKIRVRLNQQADLVVASVSVWVCVVWVLRQIRRLIPLDFLLLWDTDSA